MPESSNTGPRYFSSGPIACARRNDLGQVVQFEDDLLFAEGDAVDERLDLLDQHAVRLVEHLVGERRVRLPFLQILEIGEMQLALVAIHHVQPDVAGVAHALVIEVEIVVVLGRIDLHPIGQAFEHERQHRLGIGQRQRRLVGDVLDVVLVGVEPRPLCRRRSRQPPSGQARQTKRAWPMPPITTCTRPRAGLMRVCGRRSSVLIRPATGIEDTHTISRTDLRLRAVIDWLQRPPNDSTDPAYSWPPQMLSPDFC